MSNSAVRRILFLLVENNHALRVRPLEVAIFVAAFAVTKCTVFIRDKADIELRIVPVLLTVKVALLKQFLLAGISNLGQANCLEVVAILESSVLPHRLPVPEQPSFGVLYFVVHN